MRGEIEALEPGGLSGATEAAAAAIAAEFGHGPFEAELSARVVEVTVAAGGGAAREALTGQMPPGQAPPLLLRVPPPAL